MLSAQCTQEKTQRKNDSKGKVQELSDISKWSAEFLSIEHP
jgi:hypothetical protein